MQQIETDPEILEAKPDDSWEDLSSEIMSNYGVEKDKMKEENTGMKIKYETENNIKDPVKRQDTGDIGRISDEEKDIHDIEMDIDTGTENVNDGEEIEGTEDENEEKKIKKDTITDESIEIILTYAEMDPELPNQQSGKENTESCLSPIESLKKDLAQTSNNFLSSCSEDIVIESNAITVRNLGCSRRRPSIELAHRVRENAKFFKNYARRSDEDVNKAFRGKDDDRQHSPKSDAKKNDMSSSMCFGLFITNVLMFIFGFSIGWASKETGPSFSFYEFHLDPSLL